jgi:hypothetical protein
MTPAPLATTAAKPTTQPTRRPEATRRPASTPARADATVRFEPDSFVHVITDDLRVRSKPGVGSDSIKLEPLLWNGALAYVVEGPVAADGYDWYAIDALGEADVQTHPDPPSFGWVAAAGTDGEPWLAEYEPGCETSPLGWLKYELVHPPANLSGLACFGDAEHRLDALIGQAEANCGIDQSWQVSPAWFCWPSFAIADEAISASRGEVHGFGVAVAPDVDIKPVADLELGEWLRADVTGQYDHPAAQACEVDSAASSGGTQPPPEIVVRDCRATFVVTSFTVESDTPIRSP